MTRSMLSAGAEDADILFEDELSEERKEKLLHDAGITIKTSKSKTSLSRK